MIDQYINKIMMSLLDNIRQYNYKNINENINQLISLQIRNEFNQLY